MPSAVKPAAMTPDAFAEALRPLIAGAEDGGLDLQVVLNALEHAAEANSVYEDWVVGHCRHAAGGC